MFEKDSPQDLLLRGFSREYILDKTGTDVGYHGNAMKKELKGIDRVAYKVEFVKSNYSHDEIVAVLNEYAAGIDAATVHDRLGLAGVNIIKLNVLFKGLGLSDEFKDADKKHRKGIMKQGMLDKYGVDNPFKLDSFQQIAAETRKEKSSKQKHKNGMFNSSNIEECIKAFDIFKSQYNKDVRYPYLCDFYDKDKDLFIEVNASWTHNFHWYDVDSDAAIVNSWKKKSDDSQYYASALKIFTKSDVEKRECARKNNLNYVTLWDSDGMDADLWFAMGMPLGKDWEREYSWLPYHYIPEAVDVQNMHLSWRSLSAIVKDAQRKVFYKRELELWNTNPLRSGKWGTVQAFLYANRYKYLNKLPHELTDRMLLRAFRISGLHMGYTSFNSSLMRQVIERYNVKSVYDPCAGWGERMMTCGKLGVSYEGCDINSELFEGYKKLYGLIDGFKPVLHNNDSVNQLVTGDADAIITCPPYKGIEVYSDNGAENLSDEDFAAWWSDVVKNCSYGKAKVFAVQTNQACRGVFEYALVAQGWQFKEELVFDNNQKSHFHRSNGNDKHEYESMLVFVR